MAKPIVSNPTSPSLAILLNCLSGVADQVNRLTRQSAQIVAEDGGVSLDDELTDTAEQLQSVTSLCLQLEREQVAADKVSAKQDTVVFHGAKLATLKHLIYEVSRACVGMRDMGRAVILGSDDIDTADAQLQGIVTLAATAGWRADCAAEMVGEAQMCGTDFSGWIDGPTEEESEPTEVES